MTPVRCPAMVAPLAGGYAGFPMKKLLKIAGIAVLGMLMLAWSLALPVIGILYLMRVVN